MALVTRDTYSVNEHEKKANPDNAALFALGRVISAEYRSIRCRGIDIDSDTGSDILAREIYSEQTSYLVAIRDGRRYIQELGRLDMDGGRHKEVDIKSEGVYIITGGLGGIGLEIARHISRKGAGNVALINRTAMPDRDKWASILKANVDSKLCKKISKINSIEANGTAVYTYQADISLRDQLVGVIDEIRSKFKKINGIIHCAGMAGEGLLAVKSQSDFSKVLSPKIDGTYMLDNVTKDDEIDFFVTFSSIMSILNVPGQGDYATANAYMDAFAQWRGFQGKRTVSISWPAWKDTGMAAEYKADKNKSLFKPISVEQALSDFELILKSGSSHVIAGEIDYEMLSGISEEVQLFKLEDDIAAELKSTVNTNRGTTANMSPLPRVKLKGGVSGCYTKLEKIIGNIWGAILEIGEISIHDDFYDLGGNSLLSINMANKLKEQLNVEIDINNLFEHYSIADLAVYISEKYPESTQDKSFEDDLDKAVANQECVTTNTVLPESNKIAIQDSIINQISGLMWRQMNCLDRGFGVLIGQHSNEMLRLFKLFLGIKRCFNLEGYLGGIYSKQTFYNGNLVENQLLESFGLKACVMKVNTLESLHATICSYIDKGKPVLVCFDEYYTFYSSFYLSKHTNHLALVNGYDSSKKVYSVIDYNHLMQNGSKIINYGQFYTTFNVIEHIYSNMESMEILVLEKQQDVVISQIANKFTGILEYIAENKLQSEDLVFIRNIMESEDHYLDTESLNKLYFFLGSKELLINTLKEHFKERHKDIISMSNDILELSNALINICATSLIRGRSIRFDNTVVNSIDNMCKTSTKFIKGIKEYIHNTVW
ncbi:SDR family NAD(P)-dependent oxidoreductase [Ruminiclostridium josui]|uniref:SDR family NAD(P)-dependent oxidoreductase n=1 Tax=Ruminiclostridium josui TaxID=1499 RepID=UPI000463571D|nr:SDR family NAD(P)-dependent oxidoreductase [Ruminiclostridium josui]